MKEVLVKRDPSRATAGQAEQSPRFSTSVLEKLMSSVVITDLTGKITYWNKRAEEMRGWKSEEVMGKSILDLVPPESRELAGSIMEKVSQSGSWTGEFGAIRKNGTRFQTLSSDEALEDSNGRKVGMIDVSIDITDRKLADEELHYQESLLDQVGSAVMVIDVAGTITYWNSQAEKLYGWKRDEVLGKRAAEVLAAADRNFLEEGSRKELLQSGHWTGELEVGRKDGSRFPALVTATAVKTPASLLAGYSFVSLDITERKQMEKSLHDSEEKFRGIAERSFDGIFTTDAKGVYTYVSPAFAKLCGFDPSEMTGQSILERAPLLLESEFEQDWFLQTFIEVLSGKAVEAAEFEITRADGSRAFVEANASPVFDGERVTGVQAVVRDVTRRMKAEEDLYLQASLLDQVGRSVIMIDLAGIVVYWNRQSEELFGMKGEEAVGKPAREVLAVIDTHSLREGILDAVKQSGKWSGEVELGRQDGSLFPALVSATVVKDSSGRVVGYSQVTLDITERRQMEKTLHDSEERFRGIAERSFDGIFIVDTKGNTIYASPSLYRITGFSAEEVRGDMLKYLSEASSNKVTQTMGEVIMGRTIEGLELKATRKDGSLVTVEINASPIFDEGSSVTGIQGVVRDVTELRRAEEPKKLLASVVESSPIGMMSVGLDGSITAWNPAAEKIYGYSPKEVLGRPVSVLESPEDAADAGIIIERLTEGEKVVHFEGVRPKKDGSLFNISVDAFLIRDLSGTIFGFSSFFSDITAQKMVEEKVRGMQEDRLRFISAATHELKTPLVAIKGYSDLAASGSLGEIPKPLGHGLDVVSRNVERMLSLIQELLEIERMDNGKVEISNEVVDLKEVIMESIDDLRPVIDGKKLEVDAILPESAPHVMGDKKRLSEVMDNLLVNAVKFTPSKGRIRVIVTEKAGQIHVSVADTGIGISPASLANIFEPFSKIPKSVLVEDQEIYGLYSTGLGLALTKRLVELHRGRIWVESPGEGQGSTFIFMLPSIPHSN
jgi:PAS domain S-box-containing protein